MTLCKVDFSQSLWRYLHQPLYQRVLDYALAQGEHEDTVLHKFVLIHAKNPTIHLLVDIDENSASTINSHCLMTYLEATSTLLIDQLETKDYNFTQECFNYIDSLVPKPVKALLITNEKAAKSLKQKYKLKVAKIVLERAVESTVNDNKI